MPFAVSYQTDPIIKRVAHETETPCPDRLYVSAGNGKTLENAAKGPLHTQFMPEANAQFGLLGACVVWTRLARRENGCKIEYIASPRTKAPSGRTTLQR